MKKLLLFLCTALLLCGPGVAIAIPVSYGGHQYDIIVIRDGITWDNARTAALGYGGGGWDLVAITDQNEQNFIHGWLDTLTHPDSPYVEYWLGGFQPTGSNEPSGGWQWVTGEAFIYTNWAPGEPNNQEPDDHLAIDLRSGWDWLWNDNTTILAGVNYGYIVETVSVPEPATMLLLGTGFLGVAVLGRKRLLKK